MAPWEPQAIFPRGVVVALLCAGLSGAGLSAADLPPAAAAQRATVNTACRSDDTASKPGITDLANDPILRLPLDETGGPTNFSDASEIAAPMSCDCTVTSAGDSGAGTLRDLLADGSCGTICFSGDMTINLLSELAINRSVTVDGSGHAVVLSGNHGSAASRVLNTSGDNVVISGLTIRDGVNDASDSLLPACFGAGVYNSGPDYSHLKTLTLSNCTITDNTNQYGYGGGVFDDTWGILNLVDSTILYNSAAIYWGGGLYVRGDAYHVTTANVTNCTFTGNTAYYGGGIMNDNGVIVAVNNTLSGNSATVGAGGGGNILNRSTGSYTIVLNNIAANSLSGGNCGGVTNIYSQGGNNFDDDGTCNPIVGYFTQSSSLLLGPLGSYGGPTQTFPLLPGSAAIDAGLTYPGYTTATDQRGMGRVGPIDVGSFESQGFTLTKSGGDNQSTLVNTAFANPLSVTVTANNPGEPADGGKVVFTPPASGASAVISGSPATIASGSAGVTATANSTEGSYSVAAGGSGMGAGVSFNLANCQVITPSVTGPSSGCQGSTVTLSTGSYSAYQWIKDGTDIPNATLQTYGATQTGNYSVRVTDANGCTGTSSAYTVTFDALPTPTVNGNTTGCASPGVALSTQAYSAYQWIKDGIDISDASSQNYTAIATGTYSVRVTDSNGCVGTSAGKAVTVNANPTPTINGPTPACAPGGLSTQSFTFYQWYRNGSTIPGAINQTYNAILGGTYTVAVTDSFGCTGTSSGFVLSTPPATPTISGPSEGCASVLISTGSYASYQWLLNGSPIQNATAQSYTATQSGTYAVTVTNADGCQATSVGKAVTIHENPIPTVNGPTPACAPGGLSTQSFTSYQWYRNGSLIPDAINQSYNAILGGTYTVAVTDSLGCTGTSSGFVLSSPPATPTISGPSEGCVSVLISTGSYSSYQWLLNGSPIQNATAQSYTATQSGTYIVTVTNASGCQATSVGKAVTIHQNPLPTVSGNSANVCPAATVTLSTGSYASYQWNFNGQPITGATGSSYNAAQSGNYSVTVTDSNGCAGTSANKAVTITACIVSLHYDSTFDPNTTLVELCGDGDSVVEPGERWQVTVRLVNTGNTNATNTVATLAVNAGSAVPATIAGNPGSFGTIAQGGGTATATYQFLVSSGATCVNDLTFDVTGIQSTEGSYPSQVPAFSTQVGSSSSQNETGNQQTSPLDATNGMVSSNFTPAFTLPTANSAALSYNFAYTPLQVISTLFSDEFSTSPSSNGWTVSGTAMSISTAPKDSCTGGGGSYANLLYTASIARVVNTTGETNIALVLDYRYTGMNSGQGILVEYSTSGLTGPWTTQWSHLATGSNQSTNWGDDCARTIIFPSSCENNASFALRIRSTGTAATVKVDHLKVTGQSQVGSWTGNVKVELVNPGSTVTVLKDYGAADGSPYNVKAYYTGPGTYKIQLTENAGGTATLSSGSTVVNGTVIHCNVSSCSGSGGPPPVGSGKSGTSPALFTKDGEAANQIDVTYDATHCSGQKAVILYGNLGNYSGYAGCAQSDAGNSGTATVDGSSLTNVWFNIVWANGTTAGHPGYAFNGVTDVARTWPAAGLCGMTADDRSHSTCP